MVFIEVLRLIAVLVGASVGLTVGNSVGPNGTGRFLGAAIGVLVGYVIGGVLGRLLDRSFRTATRRMRDIPAPELLAGSILAGIGVLVGVAVCVPLFVYERRGYDYLICAGVAWILGALGLRIGMANGRRLAEAAHLTRRLESTPEVVEAGAVVVDSSALMERATLVLGRAGLLGTEVLVPEPVIDEMETLAASPDHVAARRARRGLESVAALRDAGVSVTVVPLDAPGEDTAEDKAVHAAERVGARLVTCSGAVVDRADQLSVPVVDLRAVLADLAPDHVPGERLFVDLVRPGRQANQAVGYLPDGDMVVVNDAEHLVGRDAVPIVVLSTRPTAQGLLVFARLAEDAERVRAF